VRALAGQIESFAGSTTGYVTSSCTVVCHEHSDYEVLEDAVVLDLLRGVVRSVELCPLGRRCPFAHWPAHESSCAHVEVFRLSGIEVQAFNATVSWRISDSVCTDTDNAPCAAGGTGSMLSNYE